MCPKVPPLATVHNGRRSSHSCSRRPGCWQERAAVQARTASALSVTRPRTATISRLTTFQAHVSNGFRSGLQAAWTMTRPVPAQWCKVCVLVVRAWPSQWPVCVLCLDSWTAPSLPPATWSGTTRALSSVCVMARCPSWEASLAKPRPPNTARWNPPSCSVTPSRWSSRQRAPAANAASSRQAVKMSPMMTPGHNETTTRVTRHSWTETHNENEMIRTHRVSTVRAGVGVLRRHDERRQAVVRLGLRLRGLGNPDAWILRRIVVVATPRAFVRASSSHTWSCASSDHTDREVLARPPKSNTGGAVGNHHRCKESEENLLWQQKSILKRCSQNLANKKLANIKGAWPDLDHKLQAIHFSRNETTVERRASAQHCRSRSNRMRRRRQHVCVSSAASQQNKHHIETLSTVLQAGVSPKGTLWVQSQPSERRRSGKVGGVMKWVRVNLCWWSVSGAARNETWHVDDKCLRDTKMCNP